MRYAWFGGGAAVKTSCERAALCESSNRTLQRNQLLNTYFHGMCSKLFGRSESSEVCEFAVSLFDGAVQQCRSVRLADTDGH